MFPTIFAVGSILLSLPGTGTRVFMMNVLSQFHGFLRDKGNGLHDHIREIDSRRRPDTLDSLEALV
jgi:hypothetical protein